MNPIAINVMSPCVKPPETPVLKVLPMAYWLVKSEPDAFSWEQQVQNGIEPWTGVRNFMARNNLRAMKQGDRAFFYHSNVGKEIVGVVEVAREAYPDPSVEPGEKGEWSCVDMRAVAPMPRPVTLAELKARDWRTMFVVSPVIVAVHLVVEWWPK